MPTTHWQAPATPCRPFHKRHFANPHSNALLPVSEFAWSRLLRFLFLIRRCTVGWSRLCSTWCSALHKSGCDCCCPWYWLRYMMPHFMDMSRSAAPSWAAATTTKAIRVRSRPEAQRKTWWAACCNHENDYDCKAMKTLCCTQVQHSQMGYVLAASINGLQTILWTLIVVTQCPILGSTHY